MITQNRVYNFAPLAPMVLSAKSSPGYFQGYLNNDTVYRLISSSPLGRVSIDSSPTTEGKGLDPFSSIFDSTPSGAYRNR